MLLPSSGRKFKMPYFGAFPNHQSKFPKELREHEVCPWRLLLPLERTNRTYCYKVQTHKGSRAELPIQQVNLRESWRSSGTGRITGLWVLHEAEGCPGLVGQWWYLERFLQSDHEAPQPGEVRSETQCPLDSSPWQKMVTQVTMVTMVITRYWGTRPLPHLPGTYTPKEAYQSMRGKRAPLISQAWWCGARFSFLSKIKNSVFYLSVMGQTETYFTVPWTLQNCEVSEGKDYVSVLSIVPEVNHSAWYTVYLKNGLMLLSYKAVFIEFSHTWRLLV